MSYRASAALAIVAGLAASLASCHQPPSAEPGTRRLLRATLDDKVRGGWAGQMIGVSFGAPTEFDSQGRIIEGPLPPWRPERVVNAIDQDDLYVEMAFAEVMDRKGLDATSIDFGEALRTSRYNSRSTAWRLAPSTPGRRRERRTRRSGTPTACARAVMF